MIANLLNCALEATSSIDEHGIAFMMLTLATTFHRVCIVVIDSFSMNLRFRVEIK
jgi:hypothetical protein